MRHTILTLCLLSLCGCSSWQRATSSQQWIELPPPAHATTDIMRAEWSLVQQGTPITNAMLSVGTPTAADHAATKGYVDATSNNIVRAVGYTYNLRTIFTNLHAEVTAYGTANFSVNEFPITAEEVEVLIAGYSGVSVEASSADGPILNSAVVQANFLMEAWIAQAGLDALCKARFASAGNYQNAPMFAITANEINGYGCNFELTMVQYINGKKVDQFNFNITLTVPEE